MQRGERSGDGGARGEQGSSSSISTSSQDEILAKLGTLAAGLVHDFNNVLNPIMSAAFLLSRKADSPEAVLDYADRIRVAAETGAALTARVGRFIRQQPIGTRGSAVDLSVLVRDTIDKGDWRRSDGAADGIETRTSIADGVVVNGDRAELAVAVEALLRNAREATEAKRSADSVTGAIEVTVASDARDAVLIIRDGGVGMNDDEIAHAFEPFHSSKASLGAGLGLAETYGVVRRHGGSVGITSTMHVGTTVTLRLPLLQAAVPVNVAAAPSAPNRSGAGVTSATLAERRSLHVLLVEDHDEAREFLRRLVRSAGHTVDIARNAVEARAMIAAHVAVAAGTDARDPTDATAFIPYDIMLTDVNLGDESGWSLVQYARAGLPAMRIGVISGGVLDDDEAMSNGVEFVLRKPLRAAELLPRIAGLRVP